METKNFPESLVGFSLLDALTGRRSRRFPRGMQIPDGPLAYSSQHAPQPLDARERGLLVFAAAGITGWNLGMPHTASGDPGKGANYPVRYVGRSAPSSAGTHSSELLLADDTGTYITRSREAGSATIEAARAAQSSEELVEIAEGMLTQYGGGTLGIPAVPPHISAHNRWNAMAPGTTLLAPVTDMTELFLNFLGIFTGEGVILWDTAGDAPIGDPAELLAAGRLNPEAKMPLEAFERLIFQQATADSALMAYNAQLMLQGMGLGGWLYSGIDANSLLGAHAAEGIPGFGFRFEHRPDWGLPNPIGLDDHFETLATAYTGTPDEAVQRFIGRKFGPNGNYVTDGSGPYRDNGLKAHVERYDETSIKYFTSVVSGLLSRFGRFPGTLPTVMTSVYVQAQHVDTDFYDTFYSSDTLLDTHRRHNADWHNA